MNVDAIADAVLAGTEELLAKAIAPLLERIAELEAREYPQAEEVAAKAAQALLAGDGIKSLVDLEVTAYMSANPPKNGEDAEPVTDAQIADHVASYLKANPPKDGADGVGLAGAMIDRENNLLVTLTNGAVKSLGCVVGRDGSDYEGMEVSRTYDADAHEIVERWGQKELRYPAGGIFHGGYWREGVEAKAAQTWTHAGVAWIAKRDTVQKPDRSSDDWEIFASKGRDGKDLRDAPAREPIRVGHG